MQVEEGVLSSLLFLWRKKGAHRKWRVNIQILWLHISGKPALVQQLALAITLKRHSDIFLLAFAILLYCVLARCGAGFAHHQAFQQGVWQLPRCHFCLCFEAFRGYLSFWGPNRGLDMRICSHGFLSKCSKTSMNKCIFWTKHQFLYILWSKKEAMDIIPGVWSARLKN